MIEITCALRLFRRHVIGRPHHDARLGHAEFAARDVELRDAEIEDFDEISGVALGDDEDVVWLEIAMNDARVVRGDESFEDLHCERIGLPWGELSERTDALREVGLFDERIFLYTEDTDLTRRIHRKYQTIFYPEAVIYHYNQRGSYRNAVKLVHHVVSAIIYFNKWGWFKDNERKYINERILVKFSR